MCILASPHKRELPVSTGFGRVAQFKWTGDNSNTGSNVELFIVRKARN